MSIYIYIYRLQAKYQDITFWKINTIMVMAHSLFKSEIVNGLFNTNIVLFKYFPSNIAISQF